MGVMVVPVPVVVMPMAMMVPVPVVMAVPMMVLLTRLMIVCCAHFLLSDRSVAQMPQCSNIRMWIARG